MYCYSSCYSAAQKYRQGIACTHTRATALQIAIDTNTHTHEATNTDAWAETPILTFAFAASKY